MENQKYLINNLKEIYTLLEIHQYKQVCNDTKFIEGITKLKALIKKLEDYIELTKFAKMLNN